MGLIRTTRRTEAKVIVTRANFGCGSSREHAPWVFEVNDINVVIASSFARIFRQNMFNCGMLAIELPEADINKLFTYKNSGADIAVDFDNNILTISSGKESNSFLFRYPSLTRRLSRQAAGLNLLMQDTDRGLR